MRNMRKKMSANIKYQHVDGHMDKYLFFHQLTLEQKMNTRCDTLAKRTVHRAIATGMRIEGKQLIPTEDAAVFVSNRKLTRDLAKTVRYEVGKEEARNYLMNEEGCVGEEFDEVDWTRLHGALGNKPEGYKTWLAKQHPGFVVQEFKWGITTTTPMET